MGIRFCSLITEGLEDLRTKEADPISFTIVLHEEPVSVHDMVVNTPDDQIFSTGFGWAAMRVTYHAKRSSNHLATHSKTGLTTPGSM